VGHGLDLYRHGDAEQAEGQNGDKTSDKNGAIRRVRFQQAEVEQPGFLIHDKALSLILPIPWAHMLT